MVRKVDDERVCCWRLFFVHRVDSAVFELLQNSPVLQTAEERENRGKSLLSLPVEHGEPDERDVQGDVTVQNLTTVAHEAAEVSGNIFVFVSPTAGGHGKMFTRGYPAVNPTPLI